MDRELVAFVGAGLQVIAGGFGVTVPKGSILHGYDFVEHLLRFGDNGLHGLVIAATEEIWSDWRRGKLPRIVATEHVAALPALLEAHRLERATVMGALAKANAAASSSDAEDMAVAAATARRLATLVIDQAARAGAFGETGLSQQLSFFFVERLLTSIIAERQILRSVHGAIVQYFAAFERSSAETELAFNLQMPTAAEPAPASHID